MIVLNGWAGFLADWIYEDAAAPEWGEISELFL